SIGIANDTNAFMRGKQLMIVPLLSGSGLRVKILEGMALGKTIISTTLGAKGIDCKHKENILLVDSPAEMLQCIRFCIQNPKKCLAIGRAARVFVRKHYDLQQVTAQFVDFYKLHSQLAAECQKDFLSPIHHLE
ncbi:MAG: glycosyltransferase, partial [Bacteroidota bacterium]